VSECSKTTSNPDGTADQFTLTYSMKHARKIDFGTRDKFYEKRCVVVCDIIIYGFIIINVGLKEQIFRGVYAQMCKTTSVNG
jgi:hypothetical protein